MDKVELKAFSELSGKIVTMDAEWSPVMQQGHKALGNCLDPYICQVGTRIALVRTPAGMFA